MDELYELSPEDLSKRLLDAVGHDSWPPVHDAVTMVMEKHAGQTRPGGEASACRPLRIALLLVEVGELRDANLLCAALLQDLVQHAGVTVGDLQQTYGNKVPDYVRAVVLPPLGEGEDAHEQAIKHFQTLAWEGRDPQILSSACRLEDIRRIDDSVSGERQADYLKETREGLLPLTLACNTAIYHALNGALEASGCLAD